MKMWVEVFKTGTHTDSSGNTTEYTAKVIDDIVNTYNDYVREHPNSAAPLVKGHPKDDAPALGWIERLQRTGNKMKALIGDLTEELQEDIKSKRYKNFSIALYPANNLRHIAILGAASPAVKELNPNGIVHFFAERDYVTISDVQEDSNAQNVPKITELQKQLNNEKTKNEKLESKLAELYETLKLYQKELGLYKHREYVDNLLSKKEGIFALSDGSALLDLLETATQLETTEGKEFSEENSLVKKIKLFFDGLSMHRKEITTPLQYSETQRATERIDWTNKNTDEGRLSTHNKALEYMKQHKNVSYVDAIMQIQQDEMIF